MKNYTFSLKGLLWLLLASFILIGKTSYAQEKKLLWEISNGDSAVYLVGTVHALEWHDYPLDILYEEAYRVADRVVFEVDLSRFGPEDAENFIQQNGFYPQGQTIKSHVSNKTYNLLREGAQAQGLDVNEAVKIKPWVWIISLMGEMIQQSDLDPELGVDQHFSDKAAQDNKEIMELETWIDQFKVFSDATLDKQGKYLDEIVNDLELNSIGDDEASIDAWRDSDLSKLDTLAEEIRAEDDYIYRRLLKDRNNKWIPKIVNYLNSPGITTVFAGSLHFAGRDSVIKLLENKNYKATRLPASPRLIDDPHDQTINESSNVTFSAKFRSLSSTSYQWFHNGQAIVNAKASTLTINSATENDAGNYVLKATNMSGTSSTQAVQLKVKSKNKLPVIVETYPVSGSVFEVGEEFKPYVICYDPDGTIKKIAIVNTLVPKSTWINLPNGKIKAIRPIGVRGSDPNKSYDIDFVVEDNSGAVVEQTVTFRAIKKNQPPVIVETYPVSGSKFEAGERFKPYVICYDPDGTIKKITIINSDVPKSTWTNLANSRIKAILPVLAWGPDPNTSYDIDFLVEDNLGAVVEHTVTITTFKQDAPSITKQPEDKEIDHGENVEFYLAASGTQPLEFQWYKNGKQIKGATGTVLKGATDTVLKLNDVTKEDEAIYSVKITNRFGIARSRIAQLIVRTDPPTITEQPKDAEVDLGEYAEFSVAVKGSGPFDYQWYKNGKAIEDGNKATLVIPSVSESDITIYSVGIKNQFGKSISRIAELKLKTPTITQQPEDGEIHHGENVEFHIAANGAHPIEFQWYKNGKQIKGATDTVLKLNDVTKEDEAIYSVKITNRFGIARSRIAQLIVRTDPPTITEQPKDAEVDLGEYAEFSVAVKGSGPFDYQWYKNGKAIEDGNKATLVIPSVSESDITIYSVRIKNEFGKAISKIADLKLKKLEITLSTPTVDASGRLVLIANGPPNRKVIFQFSNNFVKWNDQLTLPLSNGTTTFNVPIQSSPNAPNLFYRVKLVE